jgi:hypothetical protein
MNHGAGDACDLSTAHIGRALAEGVLPRDQNILNVPGAFSQPR